MEIAILVLLIFNLIALLSVLFVFFYRTSSAKEEIIDLRSDQREAFAAQRGELTQTLGLMQRQLDERLRSNSESQAIELAREREARAAANRVTGNTIKESLDDLRKSTEASLDKMRDGNEQKLEQMRATVDEKLQGTLEKRLGESFALVSERLEQVQKGLGEMQTLASDVGGLKRVLTNVKSRGGWGEVQLARQLEDMLTREQYAENVAIKPNSQDRVEFAITLPGRGETDKPVYLPIDSKFPQEDFEKLLEAQDRGEKNDIDQASRNVERVIIEQAKTIAGKYIEPPYSTDFAIMYLPTEGLFAEVVRRPGLASKLQNEHRVLIAGPTTLMSLLNSLQMGFRTLVIEKRSSEVWQVLSAAKKEFEKYGAVWEKLEKQLETAQNTVKDAGTRTRVLQRKLKAVESIGVEE